MHLPTLPTCAYLLHTHVPDCITHGRVSAVLTCTCLASSHTRACHPLTRLSTTLSPAQHTRRPSPPSALREILAPRSRPQTRQLWSQSSVSSTTDARSLPLFALSSPSPNPELPTPPPQTSHPVLTWLRPAAIYGGPSALRARSPPVASARQTALCPYPQATCCTRRTAS